MYEVTFDSSTIVTPAAWTLVGTYGVEDYQDLVVKVNYGKGTEAGVQIRVLDDDDFPLSYYDRAAGILMPVAADYAQYDTTGKQPPLFYDISPTNEVNIYQRLVSGVPTGTVTITVGKANLAL